MRKSVPFYQDGCQGCDISKAKSRPIIRLGKYWVLSQYYGIEGYVGWLALQPNNHRKHFIELKKVELDDFGVCLKATEEAISSMWEEKFTNDPIERIYVICFSESDDFHLHFHVIPMTKSLKMGINFFTEEIDCKLNNNANQPDYWHTCRLSRNDKDALAVWGDFPSEYRTNNIEKKEQITKLIYEHLRKNWTSSEWKKIKLEFVPQKTS